MFSVLSLRNSFLEYAGEKDVNLYKNLGINALGLRREYILSDETFNGFILPDLVPYEELCIHLDQISIDNIQLESPSTLLKAIPVKDQSFSSLQYKKLKRGIISDLKISVLDVKHQPVHLEYLSVTLHIINNG